MNTVSDPTKNARILMDSGAACTAMSEICPWMQVLSYTSVSNRSIVGPGKGSTPMKVTALVTMAIPIHDRQGHVRTLVLEDVRITPMLNKHIVGDLRLREGGSGLQGSSGHRQ